MSASIKELERFLAVERDNFQLLAKLPVKSGENVPRRILLEKYLGRIHAFEMAIQVLKDAQ